MSKAYLVESIPLGMDELRRTDGVSYTEDVFRQLADRARETIDLAAMYWSLLPDVNSIDEAGFSLAELEDLGAAHGRGVFEALADAARRGVRIRILQSPGFKNSPQESDELARRFPGRVHVQELDMRRWYGDGIMHQKSWIVDSRHIYIGSANMDWRALAQVKELGLVIEDHLEIAADATSQFDALWLLSTLEPDTIEVFDPELQLGRMVPRWSRLAPLSSRAKSPLERDEFVGRNHVDRPMNVEIGGEIGHLFITSSPPEACTPGRSSDLDGILHTIHAARESISISVMNFSPVTFDQAVLDESVGQWLAGEGELAVPLWWPVLSDTLLRAAVTRGIEVRLLVSQWAQTPPMMGACLRSLQDIAAVFQANVAAGPGGLEIRWFRIPGWDDVTGPGRRYPGHSRVNHAKYIVTDRQINIGTSNMSWSYFANTAGTSVNSTHRSLVGKLQEIFDRDWESDYASPLA